MQNSVRKRDLGGIEVLRMIAALGVMLSHVGYGYYYAKGFHSDIGVNLFFCISAFLMMYNTEQITAKNIFIRRIIRLVPLYWVLTILTFAASYYVTNFGQAKIPADQLIKSMLFIPYVRDGLKEMGVVRPIVGPTWTLTCDFWLLVIFVISIKINRKHRGLIAVLICLLMRFGGELLPEGLAIRGFMHRNAWLCYVAGICVYNLWKHMQSFKRNLNTSALCGGVCALLVILLYFMPQEIWITIFLCAAILFVSLFTFEKSPCPVIVSWFGTISYSFYLTHYYLVMILSSFFDFRQFSVLSVLGTILVLLISLFVSQICYYIFEEKLGKYLKEQLLGQQSNAV